MKSELTDRQAEVLAYIKKYIKRFGYAPTIRAIGDRFDMTVNGAAGHVHQLEARGHIKRAKGLARAMVVLD